MGVITDTIRTQYLTNLKFDLEYKIQHVTQSKMSLAQSTSDLMQVGTDYDPDSPVMKTLNQRQAKLKLLEQKLEQQSQQYQIKLRMVEAELQSVKGRLTSNISRSFSYNLGG